MLISSLTNWLISVTSLIAVITFLCEKFYLWIDVMMVVIFTIILSLSFHEPIILFVGANLFIIAEIDRNEHRIPDVFTKPALFGLTIYFHKDLYLLLIAWGWIGLMYLVTRFFPSSIGRGDIKLVGALLLLNGHLQIQSHERFLINLLFLSSILALPMAIGARLRSGKKAFAFGPAIAGAWVWLVGSSLG
jgi:hypothetical protein